MAGGPRAVLVRAGQDLFVIRFRAARQRGQQIVTDRADDRQLVGDLRQARRIEILMIPTHAHFKSDGNFHSLNRCF